MQSTSTLATNPLLYRKTSLMLLLCLLAMVGVQSYGLYYFFNIPLLQGSIDAAFSWALLGALVFFIINTFSYYHPSRLKWVYVLLLPLVLAYLWLVLSKLLILAVLGQEQYANFWASTWFYRFSVSYLLLSATTLFSIIWYQLGEKEGEQRRKEETMRMAKEAELFKLRQQLQPHLLFNSLNSINALIGSRPQVARTMVQQLSDFLRGTLKREEQKFISLHEELEYLKLYLDIEQVRFGHRLKVLMDTGEGVEDWKIPPLILQPLMENAIKFGLYGTTRGIEIQLNARAVGNVLEIEVVNPFDDSSEPAAGTGFGLTSVKRRLYLLYSRGDLLHTEAQAGIYKVLVKFPRLQAAVTGS